MQSLVRASKTLSVITAPVGFTIFIVGLIMIATDIGTEGHPSIAALAYLIGGWWMKYICLVGGVAGIVGIAYEQLAMHSTASMLVKISTVFNIVQAAAVAILTVTVRHVTAP